MKTKTHCGYDEILNAQPLNLRLCIVINDYLVRHSQEHIHTGIHLSSYELVVEPQWFGTISIL